MDLNATALEPIPPPVEHAGERGRWVLCPRCGRVARLFLEQELNVYEHRLADGDETHIVCIVP